MSDIVTTARTAREMLAKGLAALQSDAKIPPHITELAGSVAQAMGALHQIERSQGVLLAAQAPLALSHVQNALAGLQAEPSQLAAVVQAMEAVAGSLGLVRSLTRVPAAGPSPDMHARQAPPAAPSRPQVAPSPPVGMRRDEPAQRAFPEPAWAPPPPPPAAPSAPKAAPSQPRGAEAPSGTLPTVAADLGAHSPSNFYKGLSGNDIIDHGGIFVATYKIPKIGSRLRLTVSLPGGYEFHADAVVCWTRESSDSTVDTPPGFGAQFTNITPEGKQLVHRYVRNREPLFHDDL